MGSYVTSADNLESRGLYPATEARSSGVSWGAVFGGAFVAAALYLILLALGAGMGLSAVSPWANTGASGSTIGTMALVWLILIEVVASALGGYLTGRLRTKWAQIHTDEVFFRDTANGFLAWAVALVLSVTFLTSAAATMVGGLGEVRARADNPATAGPSAYFVDKLFRSDRVAKEDTEILARAEAGRIFTRALRENQLAQADQTYLAHLVAADAGINLPEAEQRVSSVFTEALQTEDAARKVTARLLLWLFLALLMGALAASFAATIGGRQRDHVKAV